MLITHVRPNELLGKKVYDKEGRLLGLVVGIAGRRGVVRGVLVREEGLGTHPRRHGAPEPRVLH